jgi:acetamidase/formamidase
LPCIHDVISARIEIMQKFTIVSTKDTVRSGFLDPSAALAASVQSGDIVSFPNTWTHWGNEAKFGMSFAEREPLRHRYPHGPYSLNGPVEVVGSKPGDALEITILALRTIDWGWNSFPLGVGALPSDFREPYLHYFRFDEARDAARFDDGIGVPLRPLVGVMAVEPAGDAPTSAIPAGSYGGNLVLRDFNIGTHLFLPVAKPGARLWVGDIHAAQGDGVVDQTGIETAAESLELRLEVHKQPGLSSPLLETDETWIIPGFANGLDNALVASLRQTIQWISAAAGTTESEAYALCSIGVSFRVTQYSHQTGSAYDTVPPKAVHAVIPKMLFPETEHMIR